MKKPPAQPATAAAAPVRERILDAAFSSFVEKGYASTSTLEIATRAKVSKRDLYAHFRDKQAMLVACISGGASRMGLALELPTPTNRAMLATILKMFGARVVREVSQPMVIATFRLAVAEAKRAPEVALALDKLAREAMRHALADFFARAQAAGLIGPGEPTEFVPQYIGLLWEGLQLNLLFGLAPQPTSEEIERRAGRAAEAFIKLHPLV